MRSIELADLSTARAVMEFRQARWSYFPVAIMLGLACLMWGAFAWHAPLLIVQVVLWFIFALLAALWLLVVRRTWRLFSSANWAVRVSERSLIAHVQEYPGAADGRAVEIPFADIISVRKVLEHRVGLSDRDSETTREKHIYLELGLADVDSFPLAGLGSPIVLTDENTLRIAWRNRTTWLTPLIDMVFEALPLSIIRLPESTVHWPPSGELSEDEFAERVRVVRDGGDKLGAIALARVRYGVSLVEAKRYVEDLAIPAQGAC